MSGHNKWSKIKHKKGAADAARSKVFSMLSRELTMLSKAAGGDPNSPSVKAAVERAKKVSMPKDNIERAIAKGAGTGGENYEEVMFEGFGPGGVAILMKGITDNNNRTSNEVKHIFSKAGYQTGAPGSASWAFNKTDEGWVAAQPIELSESDAESLAKITDQLKEHDDIESVYTNAA